jgi:hypothetical protein
VQVLNVDVLSDDMLILTVTDGTLCAYSLHFSRNSDSEDERYTTHEVRIIVLEPSQVLKTIEVSIVILSCDRVSVDRIFIKECCLLGYDTVWLL